MTRLPRDEFRSSHCASPALPSSCATQHESLASTRLRYRAKCSQTQPSIGSHLRYSSAFLVGTWDGLAEGESGRGTVKRTYEFVMNGRFLHERNISTYPPQEKNPKGEVHEHWTIFSYDRARNSLVMRQFHQEGFVNQYAMPPTVKIGAGLLFESEGFENPAGWKAREKYALVSENEFIEIFELARPGRTLTSIVKRILSERSKTLPRRRLRGPRSQATSVRREPRLCWPIVPCREPGLI